MALPFLPILHATDRCRVSTKSDRGTISEYRLLALIVFGLCVALSSVSTIDAQTTGSDISLDQLELWLNGYVDAQLDAYWIAGAAVAVVVDDRVLARGYGFRDPLDEVPVDPDTTLFRIASISKTFTWAAVMELVTEGELNFHEDVSAWIGDSAFPMYERPVITLHDLITHRGGFEDNNPLVVSNEMEETLTTEEYITTRRPQIVYQPGEVFAYSNYGAALAGYVVESVVGNDWEEWIYTRFMVPAGMTNGSTPFQDRRVIDSGRISSSWTIEDGGWQEAEYHGFNGSGAGAISASARDMAQWLRVFLNDGVVDGQRVLSEETVEEMLRDRQGYHPDLRPIHYGFFSYDDYGEKILGHGGSFNGHISEFLLFPDHDIGVFIVYNRFAPAATDEFVDAITRRIIGYRSPAIGLRPTGGVRASHSSLSVPVKKEYERSEKEADPEAVDPSTEEERSNGDETFLPEGYEIRVDPNGYYISARSNRSTMEKAMELWDTVHVRLDDETGDIELDYFDGGYRDLYWADIDLWHDHHDPLSVAFQQTRSGERVMYIDGPPGSIYSMRRIEWYQYPPVHWVIFGLAFTVFSIAVLWIPLAPWIGCRQCDKEYRRARRPIRAALWIVSLSVVPGLWITFLTFVTREIYPFAAAAYPLVIALSHSVFFISLAITILLAGIMRIRHPLGRKSVPILTRPMIVLAVLYTIHVILWNLVPWRMVWIT